MEKFPKFQAVMDEAYKGYTATMSYEEFLGSLESNIAGIVAFGNLNYQVENGGFLQWYDNGYHEGLCYLQAFLRKLDTTEAAQAALWASRVYVTLKNDPAYFEDEHIQDMLNRHDDKYYKISDKLLDQVEALLAQDGA